MMRAPIVLVIAAAPSLACCARASADLVTHAVVSYGDSTLTTVEAFGVSHAAMANSYSSPGSFFGSAEAWAAYGLVRAVAAAQTQNTSYHTQLVQAEAAFSDVLTVTGGTGTGFIVYEYTFTGSTVGSEHQAHAHAFVRHAGEPDEELEHLSSSATITSLPHFFTYGTPFSTGLLLAAEVHVHQGHSGAVLADFSAGAMLTGISIFDSNMNPVSQFGVSAGSGTSYPLPSPSGFLTCVAPLALSRRRR